MIFITGPLFAGKREYARTVFPGTEEDFRQEVIWDVQNLAVDAEDLEALAKRLTHYAIVIATEWGGGVVPMREEERRAREAAGQLSCLLAARATRVIRVFCGLPLVLKEDGIC